MMQVDTTTLDFPIGTFLTQQGYEPNWNVLLSQEELRQDVWPLHGRVLR